jgi:GNAT superfamily N-acetyltransferase
MLQGTFTDSVCTIRQSVPEDWRALRLLLPEAVYFGSGVIVLVATDSSSGTIAGAIAIDPTLRSEPELGAKIAIHVVPPFRNRGIEAQLLAAAETIARSLGARALYTWGAIEAAGDAAKFWDELGFDKAQHLLEGRTDVAAGLKYIEPFWQQLIQRGKVPSHITSLPVDKANPIEMARLYARHIGGTYEAAYQRFSGESPLSFDPTTSTAILLNDCLIGVSLARKMTRGHLLVEAVIIDTPFRGRWANLYLKRQSWQRCLNAGIHTVFYYTHDRHQDTRRFVEKAGTVIREFIEPYRMLAGQS